jgi:succinate dehydrogenase / fumarate reductase cytochrome b subunit
MASPYPKAPKRNRPKNLNLLTIRLPIPALVSIMHRVSGAFLFILLPVLLWVLQELGKYCVLSVGAISSPSSACEAGLLGSDYGLICITHVRGVRHLALDAHYGLRLNYARATSRAALIISGLLTLRMGVWLW